MKTRMTVLFLCLFLGVGVASGQLKIDFSQTAGVVEPGYEAYVADHEVAATFTSQSFSAFGATVTITPSWAAGVTPQCMQMIDRTSRNAYTGIMTDLLIDWIGTDTRQPGNPLTLTISGLPRGTYSWLSYHHDVADQTGVFSVTINDASGSLTTADINITDSEGVEEGAVDFDSITTFSATIKANGTDDVTLVFEQTSPTDPVAQAFFLMNGFEMERQIVAEATSPVPADGATDVLRDVDLSWAAGQFAASHDVYFGTDVDAVTGAGRDSPMDVLVSQGQSDSTYDPGVLELGQTYYWRVDEVNGTPDATVYEGSVWSFTVEPVGYAIENIVATSNGTSSEGGGPENVVNGSGLNDEDQHSTQNSDMWLANPAADGSTYIQFEFDKVYKLHEMLVWNYNVMFEAMLGFGLKDVTVEYSIDGADWAVLGDVEFAQATATATYTANTTVDFQGVGAKYVRLTVNSGYGVMGQYGLSEMRFLYIPVQAREPQPVDGATDVAVVDATLDWRAGREAAAHEVYLSADELAVSDGTALVDTVDVPTLSVGNTLELAQTYYWKVNEVNESEASPLWEGQVWSFSTQAFLVVDDFESYDDEENTIYETWIDGWINDTGSTVGYFDAPFAEQTIVHGGGQSMPLRYENIGGVTISEAVRTFEVAQDWTAHGIKGLNLWFYGDPTNTAGQLYVKVNGTTVNYEGGPDTLLEPIWQLWYIDLDDLAGANLANVTELTIGVEGGEGLLFIDDLALSPLERQSVTPVEPDPVGMVAHYALDGNADDSVGTHSGTLVGEPTFEAGQEGQAIKLDGIADYVQVESSFDLPVYSASVWFRVDGGTAERDVLSVYDADSNHGILLEVRTNGELRYLHRAPLGTTGGTDIYSGGVYADGNWYHAGLVKSAETVTLYINGQIAGSAEDTTEFGQALQYLLLGVLRHDSLGRYLPGAIDEVYLYDRPLSHGEIAWLAGRRSPFDK